MEDQGIRLPARSLKYAAPTALKYGIILFEIWSKPRFYSKLSSSITGYGADPLGIVWA
jgi:hypothetical protein